jgi:hypothetical protein
MERAPNAKGQAALPACPSQATHPRTPYQEYPERPFMNNLKEPNPLPNGIQESSEDPPGFIYSSYRAAQTETHRDKAPLKGSHQEVAYVSSAGGESLSTLSFEDPKTRNQLSSHRRRGGGIRDRVRGFCWQR